MADERMTSAKAWEAYIAAKGTKPTPELIDAFFEGYKAGIIDGKDTTLEMMDRVAAGRQP